MEVVVDAMVVFCDGVLVIGIWDIVVPSVVVVGFTVVTAEVVVVVGMDVDGLVILQSTSHGQLQTSRSGSKYSCPDTVIGHWNKYATPIKHT